MTDTTVYDVQSIDTVTAKLMNEDELLLEMMKQLVLRNLDSASLNLNYFAFELGVSELEIFDKLKALTGLNCLEFVLNIRLDVAAELLAYDRKSIAIACYTVGFADIEFFKRVFKLKFGLFPYDYKKMFFG
ncbi:MAG: helix-turn-helix domain-containing protein [bacterium]|nr:helix-turn-helix domain-containing protein [bacterium]